MAIEDEMVVLNASDGFKLDAFIARPEGNPKGGVVVLQEIFGATDQLKTVARTYAEDGYTAIVPAVFDRKSPQTVIPFDTPEKGRDLAMSLDPGEVLMDVAAAVAAVDTGAGVSLIGFCWGGGQAMRLACHLELTSSVAYYGTALAMHMANNPGGPNCPMLFHFGESDEHTPAEVIDAVRDAMPTAGIEMYDAGHAFANDARATFVEAAASAARGLTLAFLNQHHGA